MSGEKALSQTALGIALGLSPAAITKLKKQGMPVDSVASAQAWREARQNIAARKRSSVPQRDEAAASISIPAPAQAFPPIALPPAGDFGDEDFQMARTRREIAEANLAEMREAELEGKLIRVDAIRAAWARRIASTRDALMQLPHRLAPVLAAESDLDRVSRVLDDELRQALIELSRDPLGKLGAAQ
ncbi:MAG: hypothetical protein RL268_28 [Pseudomonadota bacterium]|jgi:anion-transporting  ArsA/GET3 family ATPase